MKHYLGIDIGGTAVKLGIVDEAGAVLAKAEESVSFDGYRTPILTTVLKAAQAFLAAQSVPAESLAGIGVSATGQIDSRKGIVAGTCGNLPNYIGAPIKAELEKTFGLPVTVANDANCMTLGEVWVGGAQGYTDVIGVTLGTGVGGGILTGGRLLEGARGLGGELGHYRTHALDGVDCTCGAKGCWERYAATTALVRAAQEKDPAWKDGRAIFAAAEAGNDTVLALLDAWTDEIAQGLAGMVHIFNPQLILIGGGVSAQQKLLIDPIAAKVKAAVMPAFAEGLEIRAAQLHNDAGMVGAVYYFLLPCINNFFVTLFLGDKTTFIVLCDKVYSILSLFDHFRFLRRNCHIGNGNSHGCTCGIFITCSFDRIKNLSSLCSTVSIDNFFKNLFQLFLGYQEVNLKKKFISRNTSVYETKILWKDFVKQETTKCRFYDTCHFSSVCQSSCAANFDF